MRVSEVIAIRVCDIIRYPEPMIFIPHSKSRRSRYVPLSGAAQEIVAVRIHGKNPEVLLLDGVNRETVSEWFKHCCEEAQVIDFTFHCLHHTFAAYMLSRGVPIYKVSKILGHSSVVVTEQHYGHLDRSVLTEEIKHVEGIVTLPKVSVVSLEQPGL
jgi:integrase